MRKNLILFILIFLFFIFVSCSAELGKGIDPGKNDEIGDSEKPHSPSLDTSLINEGEDIVDFLIRNGYAISWQDEFNGEELNTTYWNYEIGNGSNGWGNRELQYYSDNERDVFLSDGKLNIVANKVNGHWFSGRIKTQRRMQFRYGYVEASVLLPKGSGMWPAFWMLGCYSEGNGGTSWPSTGEFDIMEYSPATQGNKIYSTLHTASNNGENGYGVGFYEGVDEEYLNSYHRFGILWTEDFIEIYYDGKKVGRKDKPSDNVNEWPFNEYDAFILLNLAIGGILGGDVPDDAVKYEYLIDYVRLYQRDGEGIYYY